MTVKAKKLRREGFVTGNVFGREMKASMPVKMDKLEADHLLQTCGKGSQIMLEVDGQQLDVLIKEIDYNALKKQVEEIDFQALVNGEKVHSVAEIFLLNHDKVTEGVLQQGLHEISYKALPCALIDKIEIDALSMRVGDTIRVKDLPIASNPDIDLMTDPETTVATITVARLHAEAKSNDAASDNADTQKTEK